jgi:predicted transcriptional regulator
MGSRSQPKAQAMQKDVALNNRQIAEIENGLLEADRGDFATEEEVKQTIEKWKCREG